MTVDAFLRDPLSGDGGHSEESGDLPRQERTRVPWNFHLGRVIFVVAIQRRSQCDSAKSPLPLLLPLPSLPSRHSHNKRLEPSAAQLVTARSHAAAVLHGAHHWWRAFRRHRMASRNDYGLGQSWDDGVSTKTVKAVPCGTAARETDGTTTCIGIRDGRASARKNR
jgi:hypothetical protein